MGAPRNNILVDALRYEMARELSTALDRVYSVELGPAQAIVPTITEVGMVALLPGVAHECKIVPVGNGKVGVKIGETILKDRPGRVAYLRKKAGVPVFEAKLDDLLPSPRKKVLDGIENAGLVLITSQEIDEVGEGGSIQFARRIMDSILHELQRTCRILFEHGVERIVLTADHGYLFGEELGEDMKIDPPGGETIDLHRRVWLGRGGASDPAFLRAPLTSFGVSSDLEAAIPRSFAVFKARGGGTAYFHGGVSLQELIVPVVTLTAEESKREGGREEVSWELTPGSKKLSTRFYSVQVKGWGTTLFEITPPKVRLEIRAKGKAISLPISASYGFDNATGDVQLKLAEAEAHQIEANTITLMLAEDPDQKSVSVYLLNAETGRELDVIKGVEVAISI